VYDLKYYLVWITKYRKKVLYGQVGEQLRDLLREICKTKDVNCSMGEAASADTSRQTIGFFEPTTF
jgi:putative transposase